jgi:hypothetical protein
MKSKYKQFLLSCNADMENQECYPHESNIVDKLIEKHYIKKRKSIRYNDNFLIWLTKKGMKKVKKLQKKEKVYNEHQN